MDSGCLIVLILVYKTVLTGFTGFSFLTGFTGFTGFTRFLFFGRIKRNSRIKRILMPGRFTFGELRFAPVRILVKCCFDVVTDYAERGFLISDFGFTNLDFRIPNKDFGKVRFRGSNRLRRTGTKILLTGFFLTC